MEIKREGDNMEENVKSQKIEKSTVILIGTEKEDEIGDRERESERGKDRKRERDRERERDRKRERERYRNTE